MKYDRTKSKRSQGIVTPKRQRRKPFTHCFSKSMGDVGKKDPLKGMFNKFEYLKSLLINKV